MVNSTRFLSHDGMGKFRDPLLDTTRYMQRSTDDVDRNVEALRVVFARLWHCHAMSALNPRIQVQLSVDDLKETIPVVLHVDLCRNDTVIVLAMRNKLLTSLQENNIRPDCGISHLGRGQRSSTLAPVYL